MNILSVPLWVPNIDIVYIIEYQSSIKWSRVLVYRGSFTVHTTMAIISSSLMLRIAAVNSYIFLPTNRLGHYAELSVLWIRTGEWAAARLWWGIISPQNKRIRHVEIQLPNPSLPQHLPSRNSCLLTLPLTINGAREGAPQGLHQPWPALYSGCL